jgi:hypothetical protein
MPNYTNSIKRSDCALRQVPNRFGTEARFLPLPLCTFHYSLNTCTDGCWQTFGKNSASLTRFQGEHVSCLEASICSTAFSPHPVEFFRSRRPRKRYSECYTVLSFPSTAKKRHDCVIALYNFTANRSLKSPS